MPRQQPKLHPIEADRTVLPSFTFVLLLLMLASIVLLGILGDDETNEAQAKEANPESSELDLDSDGKAK